MKDMSDCNKNNNQDVNLKEEKLFRAMSGVDEDLLLRSGQIRNSGRVHKFPMRYVTRIAAACLCFVVAGVLYMTMSSTKMADNTGNADTAAPQSAYSTDAESAAPAEAFAMAQAENAAIEAEMAETAADMPEGAVAEVTAGTDGAVTGNLQAAKNSDSMDEKQSSGMSADADSVVSVSGNEASGAEDSMEEAEQDREETLIEKQKSPSLEKMKTKGQQ